MVLILFSHHFAPQVLYGVHIGPLWRPREKLKGDSFVFKPLPNSNTLMDGRQILDEWNPLVRSESRPSCGHEDIFEDLYIFLGRQSTFNTSYRTGTTA
jgi:hypothetical protein